MGSANFQGHRITFGFFFFNFPNSALGEPFTRLRSEIWPDFLQAG